METVKLDKTIFKTQSFEEAEKGNLFPKNISVEERLKQSFSLVCKIYGLDDASPLTIDKTIFKAYKFS